MKRTAKEIIADYGFVDIDSGTRFIEESDCISAMIEFNDQSRIIVSDKILTKTEEDIYAILMETGVNPMVIPNCTQEILEYLNLIINHKTPQ